MKILGLTDEDFLQYKKPAMFIICPRCSFKCELNTNFKCQNRELIKQPPIDVNNDALVNRYLQNNITKSIVFGGLEPMDSNDLIACIDAFRQKTEDDIIIYTGYNESELPETIKILSRYKNIIVKFGRYRAGEVPHYDEVLGIQLASNNQYAKKIN